MFKKKIEVKSCSLLKTTEKKKFRKLVETSLFKRNGTDGDANIAESTEQQQATADDEDADVDYLMPPELYKNLVKGDVAVSKAVTENGVAFDFFSVEKMPLFFSLDGRLYPTIYLLWTYPNLLCRFYTYEEVFEKLKNGADLMLPGVAMPKIDASKTDFELQSVVNVASDSLCSICIIGNGAPVAVGRTLLSINEMLSCGMKGKGVHVLHTCDDNLWKLGPRTKPPLLTVSDLSGFPIRLLPVHGKTSTENVYSMSQIENSLLNASFSSNSAKGVEEPSTIFAEKSSVAEDSILDNDTLFLLYFLCALQKRLRRDEDLPILTSTFYGTILIPSMPEGDEEESSPNKRKVTVQSTSYKKFSIFLRKMHDDGLIGIDEPKKGVESIVRVARDHPIFKEYTKELKLLQVRTGDADGQQMQKNSERPVNFRELRTITGPVLPVFQSVNKALRKGQALGAADVKNVLNAYAKSNGLANGKNVQMDALLLSCVNSSSQEKRSLNDMVTWQALFDAVFNAMTPCIEIHYASAADSATRTEIRKGKPPTIRMHVAKRTGNKKVTLIDNVEAFGIDPKAFAHELQIAVAGSATLNDAAPHSTGAQVQIQGDQTVPVRKLLTEKYGSKEQEYQVSHMDAEALFVFSYTVFKKVSITGSGTAVCERLHLTVEWIFAPAQQG